MTMSNKLPPLHTFIVSVNKYYILDTKEIYQSAMLFAS